MALVQLADIIDVTIFKDLPAVNSPEKTAFWDSGIINNSPLLTQLANEAGKTAELPFWNDIDPTDEVNYSTDDPTDIAVPKKIVQGEQIAKKAFVNQGWSEADLAAELVLGGTAMQQIRNRTDMYFKRQWQRRLIAAANGVLADNVANDSSDMVVDVASESIAGQTDLTRFNSDVFISAVFTSGDMSETLGITAVHSHIMERMVRNDEIVYMPDSEGRLVIPTYKGTRVVMDDSLPVIAGTTDGFKYVSVIFGPGAFGYGEGSATVPVEIEREATQGEGGGVETLWVRKTWLLHPFGFKQTGTPAGVSYTLAELAAATSWDRVVERKNVPMAFLITN